MPKEEWKPKPLPSNFSLLERGAKELATEPVKLGEKAINALRKPSSLAGRVGESAEGLAEVARALADSAPDVPLNVPIGPHRRYAIVRNQLQDFRYVKSVFGGTVAAEDDGEADEEAFAAPGPAEK